MKILFVGSVLFSKFALQKLISMKVNLKGVICKKVSKFNSDFYDIGIIAKENNITERISKIIKKISPEIINLHNRSYIHSDHRISFEAMMSATKKIKNAYIKKY